MSKTTTPPDYSLHNGIPLEMPTPCWGLRHPLETPAPWPVGYGGMELNIQNPGGWGIFFENRPGDPGVCGFFSPGVWHLYSAFSSVLCFRSVLQKYNIQNNDTLIDVFDRMINTGSKVNFTEEEMRMFADIERITNGSNRLKVKIAQYLDNS